MRNRKISPVSGSVEEIFKDFVTFEGDKIILKPSVDLSFVDKLEEIVEKELEVVL